MRTLSIVLGSAYLAVVCLGVGLIGLAGIQDPGTAVPMAIVGVTGIGLLFGSFVPCSVLVRAIAITGILAVMGLSLLAGRALQTIAL